MKIPIEAQGLSFILCALSGILMGCFYDFFRIMRKRIKFGVLIVAIQDIIFWTVTFSFFSVFIYVTNSFVLRGYVLIGVFLGWIIYICTLSRVVVGGGVLILNFAQNFIVKIAKMIFYPFKFVMKKLIRKKSLKPLE